MQWAQYSQVEATLQLLSAAVNRGVQPLLADKRSGLSSTIYGQRHRVS